MRVVWVSDFRMATPSGATSQAILCGKGLRDAGVDVTFCQTPPMSIRGKKYVESDIDGIRVLYPVNNMMNTIYEVDPDIVVVQCYTGALATEIGELVRGYPTAIRVGINVLELLVTPPNFANNIPKVVSFLQQADYLIAASENTKNTLLGLGCREKHIAVVPTAIDPSDFNIADCRDPTIAILGRVFPVKNHLTLIEAVKLVRKEFPDVELAITGRGRLSKMYQDLVNILCMASQIKQTGFMGDLKWLFREVSILALPSISENMPMAVLEAYACTPKSTVIHVNSPIYKAFKRKYSGKIYEIITHSRNKVRLTPNHPIFTDEGWKKTEELSTSDRVPVLRDSLYAPQNLDRKRNCVTPEKLPKNLLAAIRKGNPKSFKTCNTDQSSEVRITENCRRSTQATQENRSNRERDSLPCRFDRWRRYINLQKATWTSQERLQALYYSNHFLRKIASMVGFKNKPYSLHLSRNESLSLPDFGIHNIAFAGKIGELFNNQKGTLPVINSVHQKQISPNLCVHLLRGGASDNPTNSPIKYENIKEINVEYYSDFVYNVNTGNSVYFANGVLVHNCGIPCVLSDSGWGDTFKAPLKAKHDNPREWADLLLTLLTDREFYLKVRKRQMKELKEFTITTIVPKYLKVFEKLVALQKYKVKRHNPRRI